MTNNDMNNQSTIEHVVMRRVHIIRVLRPLLSNSALAAYMFMLTLWGLSREVWVARVFQNAPHDLFNLPNFYLAAFGNTHLIVQILSVFMLASVVYLARETARSLFFHFTPAHAL